MTIIVPTVVQVFMNMIAIRATLGPLIQSQMVRPSSSVRTHSGAVRMVTPAASRMMWNRPRGSAIQATGSQLPKVSADNTWLTRPLR